MSETDDDRTASLMTPARLAQLKVRPKAPSSPAAWLDQMAADAGSGHVRRLADLRGQLEAQVGERSYDGVLAATEALGIALSQLDFALVQPKGWLARATGKGKEAAAGFKTQYERASRAGDDLNDEVQALARKHQAQLALAERTLSEYEVEVRAIEKIMEQGARWLQDMRNQLKVREAAGGDEAVVAQVQADSARCEMLVARLKQLRAASTAAQHGAERCKAATRSRASVLESVQQALSGEWTTWRATVGTVADESAAAGAATRVEPARVVHAALQAAVEQAGKDCSVIVAQERALSQELAALQAPLEAAG
jgi:chromosome segregation ATPase